MISIIKRNIFFKVVLIFIFWKILLLISVFLAIKFIPLASTNYLGGGYLNYSLTPQIFSWANFDGEHYLSIAMFGYKPLEQAFFPLYPALISLLAKPFSYDYYSLLVNSFTAGLVISHLAFITALTVLWKLITIDYSEKIAFLTILLIVVFPTSYYFSALYNESLFLLLSVSTFYFARKKNWKIAGVFGFFASMTRVFGILLFPVLVIEAYLQKSKLHKYFWIFLIPFGLLGYMFFQYLTTGDALAFYHLQKVVGEQHQEGIITLPQVYFRYIKMLASVNINNPIYQTVLLEFILGILFFMLPLLGWVKKVRHSYIFYALFGFLMPTIQGSMSSVPRYILILFPSFLILALIMEKRPMILNILTISVSVFFLIFETAIFLRGYWVA